MKSKGKSPHKNLWFLAAFSCLSWLFFLQRKTRKTRNEGKKERSFGMEHGICLLPFPLNFKSRKGYALYYYPTQLSFCSCYLRPLPELDPVCSRWQTEGKGSVRSTVRRSAQPSRFRFLLLVLKPNGSPNPERRLPMSDTHPWVSSFISH